MNKPKQPKTRIRLTKEQFFKELKGIAKTEGFCNRFSTIRTIVGNMCPIAAVANKLKEEGKLVITCIGNYNADTIGKENFMFSSKFTDLVIAAADNNETPYNIQYGKDVGKLRKNLLKVCGLDK